ncbi:PH domain-containing protein [soil metagenome]
MPRRLHPASPFLDLSVLGRQLLAPGAVALGTGGLRLLILGAVVVLAVQVLAWRRRTYLLADGVLLVEGGLVVRSQQLVPCKRIQQVNLVQKLRHRALGVAVLDVETAGNESGVRLEVLDVEEAERLRTALLAAKAGALATSSSGEGAAEEEDEDEAGERAPRWVPAPWPVVELTYRQLAVAGMTGVELLVVFALAATASQFLGGRSWSPFAGVDLGALDALGPLLVVAAAVALLAVWLGAAVAASILTHGGYRLTLVGDELHVVRGLLDRKEASLPLARIQAVRIAASAPRRLLGLVSLRIDSAGSGSGDDSRRVSVPILPLAELGRVLPLILPGATLPPLSRPPRAALRRAVIRRVVPVAVVAVVTASVLRPWGVLALVLVPLAAGVGAAAYRGLGHALSAGFLVTRSGSFSRRTVVVPLARVQSARLRASPWQRRSGLATLSVDLAGPGPVPQVLDEAAAVGERLLAATSGTAEAPVSPAPPPASDPTGGGNRNR